MNHAMVSDTLEEGYFSWILEPGEAVSLALFFRDNTDLSYISHGEVMDGRALNFAEWSPALLDIVQKEFEQAMRLPAWDGKGTRLAVAKQKNKTVALALMEFVRHERGCYAILQDLVVDQHYRGRKLGSSLLKWLESECKYLGAQRIFMERGSNNHAADKFFSRHGYQSASVQLVKDL